MVPAFVRYLSLSGNVRRVLVVAIAAAVTLFAMVDVRRSDLQRAIDDLRRNMQWEVGTVRREIGYRADRHDRDVERVESEARRRR